MNKSDFQVNCDGGEAGQFRMAAGTLSLTVSQRIRCNGIGELSDSLVLVCQPEDNGALVVRVLVCNPNWHEPLQIACIRSWPDGASNLTVLACNLDHIAPQGDGQTA